MMHHLKHYNVLSDNVLSELGAILDVCATMHCDR